MNRNLAYIILILLPGVFDLEAQDNFSGPLFQTALMHNPSYAGAEGGGTIRTAYTSILPGNNYNLHSVYISYDTYSQVLHGGAGFYLCGSYLGGIANDISGGLTYSYLIQAGRDLYIHAGLSASVFHRGYAFGKAVFPDMIDPLSGVIYPGAESLDSRGKTSVDIDAGVLLSYKFISGALSVSHLTQPDISESAASVDRLKRKVNFESAARLVAGKGGKFFISPVVAAVYQPGFFETSAGAALETLHFSVSTLVFANNMRSLALQTGFSVSAGDISVFYAYKFNIASGEAFLPVSLAHRTGLLFRLNKIEKRNNGSTIILPHL